MKRARKQSGIGCLLALLLTACGGGGGGAVRVSEDGSDFTSSGAANIRAVDLGLARTYFPGSTAPGLTASEVHSDIEQLVGRIQGDGRRSMLMSDISLFTTRDDLELPVRLDTTCQEGTCGYNLLGASLSISVEGLSLGSVASLRPVMRHRGILLVGGAEAVRTTTTTSEGPSYPGWIDYSRFPIVSVSQSGGGAFDYGGWLDYSGFLVEGVPITSGDADDVSLYFGRSFGIASNSRPRPRPRPWPTAGSALWNGVMVATDVSGAGRENIIQGDADLSVDFGATTVDLSFSYVRDLTAGTTRTGTAWSDMRVTASGTFLGTNPQGETAGRFYGPVHEEAGGTFTYDDLAGAYGLKRQTVPDRTASQRQIQTHSEIEQLVGRIQGYEQYPPMLGPRYRSMLMSDISLFRIHDNLELPVRLDTTCEGGMCNFDLPAAGQIIDNVEDFSLGSAASLRSIMRDGEILLTGGEEAIPAGGLGYNRFPVLPIAGGEVFDYGGWLDYSGFLVEGVPITLGDESDVYLYFGRSIGIASGSRPTSGSVSWNGVMVATDVSGAGRENIIQGEADLSIDFGAQTVDLSFSKVQDLTAGTTRPDTMWRDMPVTAAGAFTGTNAQGETQGRFYGPVPGAPGYTGPGHEEAGGTFTYDDLVGAYGLKRR